VEGRVWPEDPVYFPDFTLPRTHTWWTQMILDFHSELPFDGLWIDMNEPSNFVTGSLRGCKGNSVNFPPYLPSVKLDSRDHGLADKTLCGDAVHHMGNHYDVHNLFGWSQSEPTLRAVEEATGSRALVLSRSTFVGSGRWAAHWLGDNFSNWENLRRSIVGVLQFNQFGIPLVGADICGFIGNTEPELCARWHQLGAFYPFARNHNALGSIEQDPAIFGEEIASVVRSALRTRYTLLPYLYTLFYLHTTEGSTVARPLWHEFPRDKRTLEVNDQLLWGSGLMVCPVVEQKADSRTFYLPPETRWFQITDFFQTREWKEVTILGNLTIPVTLETLPLYLRGGTILPLQQAGINTLESRRNNMELVAALDSRQAATGLLFWDDGESLDSLTSNRYFLGRISVEERQLNMTVEVDGVMSELQYLRISRVVVIGIDTGVETVIVNGEEHSDWTFQNGGLDVTNLNISVNDNFQILF